MLFRILGALFIAAGVLALVYRGFDVPKKQDAKFGPIEVSVKQHERVEIPTWAGVAAVAAGAGLLLWGGPKR
jgi:hypothetical protein